MAPNELNLALFAKRLVQYLKASLRLSLYKGGEGLFRLLGIAVVAMVLLAFFPWIILFGLLALSHGIAHLLSNAYPNTALFWSYLIVLGLLLIALGITYLRRQKIKLKVMTRAYRATRHLWDRIDDLCQTTPKTAPYEDDQQPLSKHRPL